MSFKQKFARAMSPAANVLSAGFKKSAQFLAPAKPVVVALARPLKPVVNNKLTRAISRNGETIMGWGYTLGTLTYLFKNFLEVYLETGSLRPLVTDYPWSTMMDVISASLHLISNHFYRMAKEFPEKMRTGAYFGIAGTFCVMASGIFGESPIMHAASMIPTLIGLTILALDDTTGGTELQGRFDKRLLAGLGELVSRPLHAYAGLQQGDIGQVVASLLWGIGDSGAAISSKTVRKALGDDAVPRQHQNDEGPSAG